MVQSRLGASRNSGAGTRSNYHEGADGVAAPVSDKEEAPSHSGVVTLNSARYKIGDAVTITLHDADLNTDSDSIDVYGIDPTTGFIGAGGVTMLKVTFDDRGWSSQNARPDCLAALEGITPYAGLDATGFALVETGEDSGVFEGASGFRHTGAGREANTPRPWRA